MGRFERIIDAVSGKEAIRPFTAEEEAAADAQLQPEPVRDLAAELDDLKTALITQGVITAEVGRR